MSKSTRRKTPKSKADPHEKGAKQPDLLCYFTKGGAPPGLPEGSLPSPDDAALPCSTTLGAHDTNKNHKITKTVQCESVEVPTVPVEKSQKISDMTNKILKEVSKKKKQKKPAQPQVRNSQVTDFFPVRRSNRKPLPFVKKETQKYIEEAIKLGKEDGLEVKEFPEKGRGVVAGRPFACGAFVVEYHGELIHLDEAKRREDAYLGKEDVGCYMYYFKHADKAYCIDATRESGRLGRLINHGRKEANLRTRSLIVGHKPRLAFFACRNIEPGEELLYDYGDRSQESLKAHPWLSL